MSVIAVKVTEDHIDIAADSILVKEGLKRTDFVKLRKINNMIIGGCGCAEELVLMFNFAKDNTPDNPTEKSIIEFMSKFSQYKEAMTGSPSLEDYVIITDSHAFEVNGFFVKEISNYTAIGEGERFALAALHLGHTVQEAVQAAIDLCCYTSEPIVYHHIWRE